MSTRLAPTVEQFLISKSASGLRPRSLDWYGYMLSSFTRWLPPEADPASPETIELFLNHLRQRGLAPSTVKGHYIGLSVFFGWCVERKKLDIEQSPMAMLKSPKVPKKRQRTTRPEEYVTLIDSIPRDTWLNLRDRLLVQTLFLSAVRISPLVSMKVDAYNTVAGAIAVQDSKGGNDQAVPMLPVVKSAYIEYVSHHPTKSGYLFLAADGGNNGTTGNHITANGMRQRLRKLCARAEIRYLNPHAFRHGLAVHLLNDKGADMSLIQRILGHKNLSTTAEVYARWTDDIHTGGKGLGLAGQVAGAAGQGRQTLAKGGVQPLNVGCIDACATFTLGQEALNHRLSSLDDTPFDSEFTGQNAA